MITAIRASRYSGRADEPLSVLAGIELGERLDQRRLISAVGLS